MQLLVNLEMHGKAKVGMARQKWAWPGKKFSAHKHTNFWNPPLKNSGYGPVLYMVMFMHSSYNTIFIDNSQVHKLPMNNGIHKSVGLSTQAHTQKF